MGKRVVAELARWLERPDAPGPIGASVGLSVSVAGRATAEVLLGEADRAMYEAKSRGGAGLQVFDAALGREVQTRTAAELMINTAIDEGRIVVRYQPIVDLGANMIAGFEALARIAEHDGTLLSPDAFIPVAEASGLIVQLGARVLDAACVEAGGWQAVVATEREVSIAVNLSPRQFDSGNLMATVLATLDRTGLDPVLLHLEITETAIIDLSPDLLRQLGQIRNLGVQIGLDDFGTGYASLTHLRRLPLTFVKIDRSFVGGLIANHEDERIVSAVIDLAANLGLRSIAEGVETPRQLDRLRELGCDQAQGYIFAKPLPAEAVAPAIQAR
jgi:EAL domain-containing protein (putative c-di-GMP-specific phosphodiesterase class I)